MLDVLLTFGALALLAYFSGNNVVNALFVMLIFFPFVYIISYAYTSMLIRLRINLFTYLLICAVLSLLIIAVYFLFPGFFMGYDVCLLFIVIQFTLIYFFLKEVYRKPR